MATNPFKLLTINLKCHSSEGWNPASRTRHDRHTEVDADLRQHDRVIKRQNRDCHVLPLNKCGGRTRNDKQNKGVSWHLTPLKSHSSEKRTVILEGVKRPKNIRAGRK